MATATEIEQWALSSDKDWVAAHVPRFGQVRANYLAYAEFLKVVLKRICDKLAPLGIVEVRAKGMESFGEKILRKRKVYVDPRDPLPKDPLQRMTDLCGGRVITQTADQVQAVCEFIKRAFDIDMANSEDVSKRLKPTEFGYRSVHYIVMVNGQKLKAAGIDVPVPPELIGPAPLKAEIQVRTLLEHAWSDIGHDMTYKTELKVPDRIHRQCATLAAVLESVDQQFGHLVHDLEQYRSNIGAHHPRKEVIEEIARLRIVLSCSPGSVDLAVKAAQMALSIGRHDEALEILSPYADQPHRGVQRVRGTALTEMYWDTPHCDDYVTGHQLLVAACEEPGKDAETLCLLAESHLHLDDEASAREVFHKAMALDPGEPATLSRYIVFEIARSNSDTVVHMSRPLVTGALGRCRNQIEARVNLSGAWASRAIFHLLLGQPYEALSAIAQVISLCEVQPDGAPAGAACTDRPCAARRSLVRLHRALRQTSGVREKLAGFDWCQRLVLLGLALRLKDAPANTQLQRLASLPKDQLPYAANSQVVIVSGGCSADIQGAVDRLGPMLRDACAGLSFNVLCGGTPAGVSGLVGDVAEASGGRIKAFGYLPRLLPRGIAEETNKSRYAACFNSPGVDFTPMDPLQGWTDIVVAGVQPQRVKFLFYAGGQISRAECAIALALGARVGVIEDSTLPENRQFKDADWNDQATLVRLPLDRMTLRAFLLVDELPCKKDEFEKAARRTHEEYVKSATPRDASLQGWEKLSEVLKISNYHQIAYAENILSTVGLGVRKIADAAKPLLNMVDAIGEDSIRRLAEMEHGRWNVERLLLGWRYADVKDIAKKHSPYLIPWPQLTVEIQGYDIDAMRTLPAKFKEAGLEVYKL